MRNLIMAGLLALALAGCKSQPPAAPQPKAPEPPYKVERQSFKRVLEGCGESDLREAPCSTFQASWVEVTKAPNPQARERINEQIRSLVGATQLEEQAEELFERYARFRELFPSRSVTYFVRRTAELEFQRDQAWSVALDEESFQGGADATSQRRYLNLDPRTGAELALPSLLKPGAQRALQDEAERRFRAQYNLEPDDSLAKAGFRFPHHRFALSDQWGLAPKGLVFHYNCLEIAPRAYGPITVVLPWEAIGALIRNDAGLLPAKR